MKNDFLDELIKEKLNQQSYEFTPADWSSFESKQAGSGSGASGLKWLLGGAAAITVIAIASYFIFSEQNLNTASNESNEHIISKTNQESSNQEIANEEHTTNTNSSDIGNNNTIVNEQTNSVHTPVDNKQESNNAVVNSSNNNNNTNNNTADNSKDQENTTNNNSDINTGEVTNNVTGITQKEVVIPSALVMSSKLAVCPNENVSFETIEQSDVIYAWNFGDDTYSNERVVSHSYTKPGKYVVSLIVTSTVDHSILSKSKDVMLEVLPIPNTDFEIKYMEDAMIPSVQLVSSEFLPNYYWDFSDGTNSTESSPIKSFKRKGYYNVTLTSKNHEGCKASTTKKVTIKEDYNLLAPNSFTPNGDGINDFFIPEALKTMGVEFTMNIYSQNEGLIFESKNINQQWDGRNQQNGINCNEGTYIWVVSLINSDGKSEQYKGAVLLLK